MVGRTTLQHFRRKKMIQPVLVTSSPRLFSFVSGKPVIHFRPLVLPLQRQHVLLKGLETQLFLIGDRLSGAWQLYPISRKRISG
jgi:hypothetical protein